MTANFMHIGKFVIDPTNRDAFISLMKEYEQTATQSGLDHAHVIEDEGAPGTFMHITVWDKRDNWVAVEKTDAHLKMHAKRNEMLAEPMQHDFVCGTIEV